MVRLALLLAILAYLAPVGVVSYLLYAQTVEEPRQVKVVYTPAPPIQLRCVEDDLERWRHYCTNLRSAGKARLREREEGSVRW